MKVFSGLYLTYYFQSNAFHVGHVHHFSAEIKHLHIMYFLASCLLYNYYYNYYYTTFLKFDTEQSKKLNFLFIFFNIKASTFLF